MEEIRCPSVVARKHTYEHTCTTIRCGQLRDFWRTSLCVHLKRFRTLWSQRGDLKIGHQFSYAWFFRCCFAPLTLSIIPLGLCLVFTVSSMRQKRRVPIVLYSDKNECEVYFFRSSAMIRTHALGSGKFSFRFFYFLHAINRSPSVWNR